MPTGLAKEQQQRPRLRIADLSRTELGETLSTHRIEALCDGVFAIAMTLLVLEIRMPSSADVGARSAFAGLWPSVVSYAASFGVLGVYWVGQHTQFHFIRHADQVLLWTTLLFLMLIAAIPFSATLIGHFEFARWAVVWYGCHLIAIGTVHHLVWRYASYRGRLIHPAMSLAAVRMLERVSLAPIFVYLAAIGLAFVNPPASVFVYVTIPAFLILRAVLPKHRHGRD
jgi:uncharacterized membrane protein